MSPRGGTLPGNRKGPPHNARTVALLLEVSEAQRQAIPKTYRFSVLVSLRLPITTLIATAHRATACETGSSDRHHADTEHDHGSEALSEYTRKSGPGDRRQVVWEIGLCTFRALLGK